MSFFKQSVSEQIVYRGVFPLDSPFTLYLWCFLLKPSSMPQRGALITLMVASSNSPVGGRSFALWKTLQKKTPTNICNLILKHKAGYCLSRRYLVVLTDFIQAQHVFVIPPSKWLRSVLPESFYDLLQFWIQWISIIIQIPKLPQISLCGERDRQHINY